MPWNGNLFLRPQKKAGSGCFPHPGVLEPAGPAGSREALIPSMSSPVLLVGIWACCHSFAGRLFSKLLQEFDWFVMIFKVTFHVNAAAQGSGNRFPSFSFGQSWKKNGVILQFVRLEVDFSDLGCASVPWARGDSFCCPLRQTCAGKYLGLMRRAKGWELGRWVSVCGTANKEQHL